jgi:hypothetical protein
VAINIPIITEFADAGLKSARGAFDNFKTKVAEAEGGMGKFKAGANAAMDSVKANAAVFAVAAGVAIAKFAVDAINDFKDLALSVDDFRNKTNLTLLQSSQWMSYSGDLGIAADSITKIFSRLAKAATDQIPTFKELGVEIALGPDGATDIERTFFRVNDAINSLDDPVKQAAYRADLFGRGWMDAAEILQMSSSDITTALQGVKDFEVIDEEEIEKAKDLRRAQDELADAFANISVTLGQALIPAFTALVDAARPILDLLAKIDAEAAKKASKKGGLTLLSGALDNAGLGFATFGSFVGEVNKKLDENEEIVVDNYLSTDELYRAWKDGTRQMIIAKEKTEDLTDALKDSDNALMELKGNVDDRREWDNLIDAIEDAKEAAIDAFFEATPEALRESQRETDNARVKVAEYINQMDNIPDQKKTEIIANLDRANLPEIEAVLANLTRAREISIMPVLRPGAGGINEIGSGGRPIGEAPLNFGLPELSQARLPTRSAVTVNVAGSVISENDLVETVRKGLVNSQRNGAGLVYSNR